MVNWRHLTGRELDMFIAKRLDWRVERVKRQATQGSDDLFGVSDDGGITWDNLPRYSKDTNAALDLVLEQPGIKGVQIHKVSRQKYIAHVFDNRFSDTVINANGASPSLAVCYAWLTWCEGGQAEDAENG